ncbi:MAG TPA: hypothetical protein VF432_28690 [Thermoanaerobaculia bacterium]
MSVRIKIGSGASFPATTANQSDLVFWYNDDKKPHYPVPRCEGLKVAAGGTTSAYQPIPQPAFPVTVQYVCALHPGETGDLTVQNDPGGPAQAAGTVNATPKEIAIGPGGTFASIDVVQSDNVVWKNGDRQTHWPVPNCWGLRVNPQAVSNDAQFFPPPLSAPLPISYGCAIEGHESERGSINVYADFTLAAQPVTVSSATPYASVPIATGGKSPYVVVPDSSVPYLSVSETTPVGSSTGLSVVLNAAPPSTGTINYELNVTDALGNPIHQSVQIKIT